MGRPLWKHLQIRDVFETVRQAEEEATWGGERARKASFTGRLESEPRNLRGFSSLGKITGLRFQLV